MKGFFDESSSHEEAILCWLQFVPQLSTPQCLQTRPQEIYWSLNYYSLHGSICTAAFPLKPDKKLWMERDRTLLKIMHPDWVQNFQRRPGKALHVLKWEPSMVCKILFFLFYVYLNHKKGSVVVLLRVAWRIQFNTWFLECDFSLERYAMLLSMSSF